MKNGCKEGWRENKMKALCSFLMNTCTQLSVATLKQHILCAFGDNLQPNAT